MKYILVLSILVLTACGSSPSRCNQKLTGNVHHDLIEIDGALNHGLTS